MSISWAGSSFCLSELVQLAIIKQTIKNKKETITEGRLNGNSITFTAGDAVYSGTVTGNIMEGTCIQGGKKFEWSAVR